MQITLIAIGKRMPQWVELAYLEYAKRLPRDYQLNLLELDTPKRSKGADIQKLMEREGELILAAIPKNNLMIALDVQGKSWNTPELSTKLKMWHDESQDISLVIGGPDGISANCLAKANIKWSLSNLTLPHPLVRIIIAEQIYRAWSIIIGHPYHR